MYVNIINVQVHLMNDLQIEKMKMKIVNILQTNLIPLFNFEIRYIFAIAFSEKRRLKI